MTRFKAGEVVDVQIRGARISGQYVDEAGWVEINNHLVQLPFDAASVTVVRRAPREWPPNPGELWADGEGMEFFAIATAGAASSLLGEPWMVGGAGVDSMYASELLARRGPLRRLYPPVETPPDDRDDEVEQRRVASVLAVLADGVDAGLPAFYAVTFTADLVRVQMSGPGRRDEVDPWVAHVDPTVRAAVTDPDWRDSGRDRYAGTVEVDGQTIEFWTTVQREHPAWLAQAGLAVVAGPGPLAEVLPEALAVLSGRTLDPDGDPALPAPSAAEAEAAG
jgi:hypothetical protein